MWQHDPMEKKSDRASGIPVERTISYRLSALSNGFSLGNARIYSKAHQLTLRDWRVLNLLWHHEPATSKAIGDIASYDKGQMSRAVKKLEGRKLLDRVRQDNLKSPLLTLTPKGRTIVETIYPIARRREEELLSVLNDSDRRTFDALLDRLLAKLGELD